MPYRVERPTPDRPTQYERRSDIGEGTHCGTVRTIAVREHVRAASWTHAYTEVDWGMVAMLRAPATTEAEIDAHHADVVATLTAQPWPAGFDEAVRRWANTARIG